MSKLFDRTVVGAFAFLLAVAVADVSVARAQTGTGPTILPTSCGAGVLDECARQNTYHCEWKVVFNFSSIPWGGGISFVEVCEVSGTRPIYKDRLGQAAGPACSVPAKPLGPPGATDDETGVPYEGDGTCGE